MRSPESHQKERHEFDRETPYRIVIKKEAPNEELWRRFDYDDGGFLIFKDSGLRVVDLLRKYGFPYPIKVTDTLSVEQECRDLKQILAAGARIAGYPSELLMPFYATKANPKAAVVAATLHELPGFEVSGPLDLENYERMLARGLISVNSGPTVICNGFKGGWSSGPERGYARRIVDLASSGADLIVVLDQNELPYYRNHPINGVLEVGLRVKAGMVTSERQWQELVSQFGFDKGQLWQEAEKISQIGHLKLVMIHAMVSAAYEINPKEFADYHLFFAEQFVQLARTYPTLRYLNLGGGLPPEASGYDYQEFLVKYLRGLKKMCQAGHVPLPKVVFEAGSFITNEAEMVAFPIFQLKTNSTGPTGQTEPWAVMRGNLINALPDRFIRHVDFHALAIANANRPVVWGRYAGSSCDSDDTYPNVRATPRKLVPIPKKINRSSGVAFVWTGAYQDLLGGFGTNVGHGGSPVEPVQVYIGRDASGKIYHYGEKRTSLRSLSQILGY